MTREVCSVIELACNSREMLSSFISGRTPSSMIIIEDRIDHSGNNLLHALIHNASVRQFEVHVLCFENPVEKWKLVLNDNVNVHDCFTDHRGWNNETKKYDLQHVYGERGLLGAVQELVSNEGKPHVVCIDSLTPVLFRHGLNKCYRDLHALLAWAKKEERKLNQLVAVIHEDSIPEKWNTLVQLRHLATTVLQIQPTPTLHPPEWGLVRITHRKAGGKVLKQLEEYKVDESYSVVSKEKKNQKMETEVVDPTVAVQNLTTFKLMLNPQEEAARSQVVLPYTRQARSEEQAGGGKVFYEPDEADDWDDEDPDDDLDV